VDTVKEIRRRKGWSQKDLAEESGVGQDTISGIESGRHEPRPSTLRKLADALDVEVADFFREPAVPLAETSGEAGPESEYSKEDRLEILRRIEMAILSIVQQCHLDLETIDTNASDRKATADQLINVAGRAFWSYTGAKQHVDEDEIVQEAVERTPEERRAARRVYAALTELFKTFNDITSAIDSFAARADASAGKEGATITYIGERLRERAS
jgi:transcriptional regulator with XRE-family HTH domain